MPTPSAGRSQPCANPTRRAILARLSTGKATVTELAAPFDLSLPAISKHLKVLERAQLIARGREAQWRPCTLRPEALRETADWIERYRELWEANFQQLDALLDATKAQRPQHQEEKETMTTKLEVWPLGELEIVMTRAFDAPRALVFDAWTKPELLQQWLGVRDGWTMPVCEIDLRAGGAYRYVWKKGATEMGVSGVYRKIVAPERIVATERFGDPWYPGDALITHVLEEVEGRTMSTITMHYESKEARDTVLASPMESGVAQGYAILSKLLDEALTEQEGNR